MKILTNEGIVHIEDLPVDEFIVAIKNLNQFEISEKVDGANLQFGLDENNKFYTSREGKGGDRYYSIKDWGNKFWQTGFKSAHQALSQVAPLLKKQKAIQSGDIIEVEILFGALPNTVPYTGDVNQIIFLRSIQGTPDIEKIKNILSGKTVSVTTTNVPITNDGKTIEYVEKSYDWAFAKVPSIDPEIINKKALQKQLLTHVKALENYLNSPSGIYEFSNAEVLAIKLSSRPSKIDKQDWAQAKQIIANKRTEILENVMRSKLEIKESLLNGLIRKIQSGFGPSIQQGGWIEGVVARHKLTGEQFKIVDKSLFTAINHFNYIVRNKLAKNEVSDKATSLLGKLLVKMGMSFQMPELGTVRARAALARLGSTPQQIISNLASKIDFNKTKLEWIDLLQKAKNMLSKALDFYSRQREKLQKKVAISGQTRTFSYAGEINNRTLQTFAELFEVLDKKLKAVESAKTSEDLARAYIGDKIES